MDMTINHRLAQFLHDQGIKQEQLRAKLGIKNRQQISNWLNSRDPLPDKHMVAIIRLFPMMNANWFIHGFGEPLIDQKVLRQVNRNEYGFCEDCMEKDNKIEILQSQLASKGAEIMELCKEIGRMEERLKKYESDTPKTSKKK